MVVEAPTPMVFVWAPGRPRPSIQARLRLGELQVAQAVLESAGLGRIGRANSHKQAWHPQIRHTHVGGRQNQEPFFSSPLNRRDRRRQGQVAMNLKSWNILNSGRWTFSSPP